MGAYTEKISDVFHPHCPCRVRDVLVDSLYFWFTFLNDKKKIEQTRKHSSGI